MPSTNPHINVVCEKSLYGAIAEIALRDGASLSSVAHDLLLESLELREDIVLSKVTDKRAARFDRAVALTADKIFG
jgi:transcriptional antiterminator Rof (Rho-off)